MSILGPLAGSEPRTDRLVEAEDSPDAVWTFLPLAREGGRSSEGMNVAARENPLPPAIVQAALAQLDADQ